MISTLRSIDSLLNRFDELSNCHANFLSNFDTNFSDVKNPLRNVSRTEEEQRKTTANILLDVHENDDRLGSIRTLEDFNRRIIKNRYLHRPPSYSSNDGSLINRIPSRSSSITTESTSLPRISQITNKANNPQPVTPILNHNIIKPKVNLTTKVNPNVVSQNSSAPRRYLRGMITAFTMETVNRLSKPKIYNRLPDQRSLIKRVKQRPKPHENVKKEASKCSTLPSVSLPPINRTNPTTSKPSSKTLKAEKKIPIQTSKRNPLTNLSRPLAFVVPAPTIRLSFPTQSQQKSSCVGNLPKIITTTKRSMIIHSKT